MFSLTLTHIAKGFAKEVVYDNLSSIRYAHRVLNVFLESAIHEKLSSYDSIAACFKERLRVDPVNNQIDYKNASNQWVPLTKARSDYDQLMLILENDQNLELRIDSRDEVEEVTKSLDRITHGWEASMPRYEAPTGLRSNRIPKVAVPNNSLAARSSEFTEERDQILEEQLFTGRIAMGINFAKYKDAEVHIEGSNVPQPLCSNDFGDPSCLLHDHVKLNIRLAKYTSPTPIQKHTIPITLARRDLMACAQTGSGKTLAFIAPIVSLCLSENIRSDYSHSAKPVAVIVVPTRELAVQIYDEARKFTYRTGVRPCVVYGGTFSRSQLEDLQRGCQILIGTPGRLKEFVETGAVSLVAVRFFVLDEADRMLDLGFEPQIRRIMDDSDLTSTEQRQTMMFSATFPIAVQELAKTFLKKDYVFVTIGPVGAACENITQTILEVGYQYRDKRAKLVDVLSSEQRSRILIFVKTKREVDDLDDFLISRGFPATSIHGDRNQVEREAALLMFKKGELPILIATDVASRGLDIPGVDHVIVYDMPSNLDDYVHRIGRTARAGNVGKATAFFTRYDAPLAQHLIDILETAGQEVPKFLRDYVMNVDLVRGGYSGMERPNAWLNQRSQSDIGRKPPGFHRYQQGGNNYGHSQFVETTKTPFRPKYQQQGSCVQEGRFGW